MPGAANPGAKALTVIASLLAGRDYIDHVNVLRAGRSTYDAGLVERTWVREVVMSQPDNVAIARKFHEAWTERDPEGGAALIAADCEFYDVARGEPPRGPEGYKRDYNRWLAAFPDGQCEVTHVVDGGEWVVVEFTNRGTNTGSITTALGRPVTTFLSSSSRLRLLFAQFATRYQRTGGPVALQQPRCWCC